MHARVRKAVSIYLQTQFYKARVTEKVWRVKHIDPLVVRPFVRSADLSLRPKDPTAQVIALQVCVLLQVHSLAGDAEIVWALVQLPQPEVVARGGTRRDGGEASKRAAGVRRRKWQHVAGRGDRAQP